MANPDLYHADVRLTPKGAKVDLGTFYMYPDGHANLTFADGRNWPFNDQLQAMEGLTQLVRQVQNAARSKRDERNEFGAKVVRNVAPTPRTTNEFGVPLTPDESPATAPETAPSINEFFR